jgi:hypothetical protein
MVRVRYIALSLCGLLISGGGPAEARGGGGHTSSHDTSHNSGPYHQIPQGYHQILRADIQGSRTYRQFPYQGSQAYRQTVIPGSVRAPRGSPPRYLPRQIPGGLGNPYSPPAPNPAGAQRAMMPVATGYASAPLARQFQYSCTINANQPDAGGACVKNSSARIYSGDRCRCGRQYGTID